MVYRFPTADYTGMDQDCLQRYKTQIETCKAMYERNIVNEKQQIRELKHSIKVNEKLIIDANNELLKIEEALKHTHEVVYVPVITVKKRIIDKYLGKTAPTYYCKSDWKESVAYYFEVCNINVLGADKGSLTVFTSIDYNSNAKAQLNADIILCAKQRGVKKIYLDDGVKINATLLRKEIPDINIQVKA